MAGYVVGPVKFFLVRYGMLWYGILGFSVPLDTVQVILETGALSSDVHLPFSKIFLRI